MLELEQVLTRLKDLNAIIDPVEMVQLIETVGGYIDELDLEIVELELSSNQAWKRIRTYNDSASVAEVANEHKLSEEYQNWRKKLVLLKSLRRHYRLLNTKLNLLTKPKGR